jgi:hypothetical protein
MLQNDLHPKSCTGTLLLIYVFTRCFVMQAQPALCKKNFILKSYQHHGGIVGFIIILMKSWAPCMARIGRT